MLRLVVGALSVSVLAFGTTTTFTDLSAWTTAAQQVPNYRILPVSDFSPGGTGTNGHQLPWLPYDLTLLTPDIAGSNGHWTSNIGTDPTIAQSMHDIWQYAGPLYGFAADDIQANGGHLLVNGLPVAPDPTTGFWGFVTDAPTQYIIWTTSDPVISYSTGTEYFLDPPVGSAAVTPEPTTYALSGLGFLTVAFWRRKRSKVQG